MTSNNLQSRLTGNRRSFVKTAGAAAAFGLAGCMGQSGSTPDTVQIASNVPLSGPFAAVGQLANTGAKFAANRINEAGGVESLDGAEIEIIDSDAGGSTDEATTAARNVIDDNNLTAMTGAWLSSYTLAVISVTERESIPLVTQSYSDGITEQGYEYVFKASPKNSNIVTGSWELTTRVADEFDREINRVAFIRDNAAAAEGYSAAFKSSVLENEPDVELVAEEVWSPPLDEPTPVVRRLEETDPDIVYFGGGIESGSTVLQSMLSRETYYPLMGITPALSGPELLANSTPESVKMMSGAASAHQTAPMVEAGITDEWLEFTDEPYLTADPSHHFAHVYLIKEACERAESADSGDVRDTLSQIELTEPSHPTVMAKAAETISFDENGQLNDPSLLLWDWQDTADVESVETDVAPLCVRPQRLSEAEMTWAEV